MSETASIASYDPADSRVGVVVDRRFEYGPSAPFSPPARYPEYPFGENEVDPRNTAYEAVREALRELGLDRDHFGTRTWNPLGGIIHPGDRVVLKPNAVLDHNQDPSQTVFASITHPSVLRAISDYCWIALERRGELVIADAPLMSSNFDAWRHVMQIDGIEAFYASHGLKLRVIDLRETTVKWMLGFTPAVFRKTRRRDPLGYTDIDLGPRSFLAELGDPALSRAYGADYRVDRTIRSHTGGHHTYRVSNTVLSADVLIPVPKLKFHKKVGVTMAIKGMVGIIGDKNTIVHHRRGAPRDGGDEYPIGLQPAQAFFHDWRTALITRFAAKQTLLWDAFYFGNEVARRALELALVPAKKNERLGGGCWSGNDTAWRMGGDLLRIALYGRNGERNLSGVRRRTFVVVDGIIGGDLHGPLAPRARSSGAIVAGANPVAVDWVAARIMNIDPNKLPLLTSCRRAGDLSWTGDALPVVCSTDERLCDLWTNDFHLGYEAPIGWRHDVEVFDEQRPAT